MNTHPSIQCPIPKSDLNVITLGHGSGGQLTHQLLDSGVFNLLRNEHLDKQHDGAVLDLTGPLAFTTDSFVVSPIFFPGGNIGDLAVNGTVNDLAMCGAIPRYLSLSFILEEGLKMEDFWKVVNTIKTAADQADVQIVTGDTKVVEHGKGDQLFINTAGIGQLHPKAHIEVSQIQPGDLILVSGSIARHGTAILSVREGLSFESSIQSDTCSLHEPVIQLLDSWGPEIHMLRDATRGGIATVLAEISSMSGSEILIQERDIPITDAVCGACEMLGMDPLYIANEGVFIAVVNADVAEDCIQTLHSFECCSDARIIGKVTAMRSGKALLEGAFGGTRILHLLPGEQLPRIC